MKVLLKIHRSLESSIWELFRTRVIFFDYHVLKRFSSPLKQYKNNQWFLAAMVRLRLKREKRTYVYLHIATNQRKTIWLTDDKKWTKLKSNSYTPILLDVVDLILKNKKSFGFQLTHLRENKENCSQTGGSWMHQRNRTKKQELIDFSN